LPRHAAIESAAEDRLGALVQNADIIYFPSEPVNLGRRSDPAWRLLETLKQNGSSFAVGWEPQDSDKAEYRLFVAEARKAGGQILALAAPAAPLVEEDPMTFEIPPGDFERFARRPTSRGLGEAKLRAAYQAASAAEQFAAARIAAYSREHRGEKMLIFVRRDAMGSDHGIPYFVAQKTKARQLILEPPEHVTERSRLMAWNGRARDWRWHGLGGRGLFEIVDGSPFARGDER
jgi:hypothetical protein